MLGVAVKIFRRVSAACSRARVNHDSLDAVVFSAVIRGRSDRTRYFGLRSWRFGSGYLCTFLSVYDTIARAPALPGPSHILTFVVEPLAVLLPHLLKPLQHQTHHAWCVFPAILPIEGFSIAILELRRTS